MRILILRLSSLGDIALLNPVFEALRAAYPNCVISCLVKRQYRELVESNTCVNEVITYKGFWLSLNEIRNKHFDIVLDLHGVLRTRLLTLFVKAGFKQTYNKESLSRYAMVLFHSHANNIRHTTDRYMEALKTFGIGVLRPVVFQTAFLGDAVLTVPLLKDLKNRLAVKNLVVVCRPEHRAIFEREGCEVFLDDKRGSDRGLRGFFNVLKRLKARDFDFAIIPHRSLRTAMLARLARIPVRIGFSNSVGRWFLTRVVPFHWAEHDSERNLRLAELLPVPAPTGVAQSVISPLREDRAVAQAIWNGLGLDSKQEFFVGIAPGSKWETKKWPKERFASLAKLLQNNFNSNSSNGPLTLPSPSRGEGLGEGEQKSSILSNAKRRIIADSGFKSARVILLGGPEEKELCEEIISSATCNMQHVTCNNFFNLAGKLSLKELVAVMGDLKLFISNDSGPTHIACGLGVPTVAIFGPTVRGFGFYPKGKATRVVEAGDLECRPCSLHGGRVCPRGHFLCMRLITVDQVMKACEEVLKN